MSDTRTATILRTLARERRSYDSSVARVPDHHDALRDLQRKAGLDPRGITGNRIIAVRPQ